MPKAIRPATQQGQYRTNPISIASNVPSLHYYPNIATTMQSSMSSQNMSYSTGGPVQHSSQHHYLPHQPATVPPPISIRASSGAWTPSDDNTLMTARAQGLNWAPIQAAYFPSKTPNACRKRHERLMDRRNTDDWDTIKLENLGKEYMSMRREIWSSLAARTGEKWSVVEAKCMSAGLKNLQSHSRAYARRERLESGSGALEDHGSHGAYGDPHNTDDSGIGIEDLEAEYSPDGGSFGSSPERPYGGASSSERGYIGGDGGSAHQRTLSDGRSTVSVSGYDSRASTYDGRYDGRDGMGGDGRGYIQQSNGTMQRPAYGMQNRLPSIDMGIGRIINPSSGV